MSYQRGLALTSVFSHLMPKNGTAVIGTVTLSSGKPGPMIVLGSPKAKP